MKRLGWVLALCVGCNFTSRPMLPNNGNDASIFDPLDDGRTAATDAPVARFDTAFPTDVTLPPPVDASAFDAGVMAPDGTTPAADAPTQDAPAIDLGADSDSGTTGACDDERDGGDDVRDGSRCDAGDAGDAHEPDSAPDASDLDATADR